MVGDVALGFDIEEEVTEPVSGVTPNELEQALTDRPQADINAVLKDSGGRVGINRAPDPQFDLDVAGSVRTGGYFVGRHALQVTGLAVTADDLARAARQGFHLVPTLAYTGDD